VSRRARIVVFAVALLARLVHLGALRSLVWFDVPLVDGANYLRTARLVLAGDWLGGREAFWQPPLYPYFMAAVLGALGGRLGGLYVVQAVLGALTCVVTGALGARLFGVRAGVAAGLMMALYGPLVHFDVQPLIPVLHIALLMVGLLLLVRAVEEENGGARLAPALAGLAWGLSAIATPNVLLAAPVPATLLWMKGRPSRRLLAAWAVGLAAPVLLVAARNFAVAGEPVLISSNGGINFFIGNNADYDRTIRVRPGGEFERLSQEPENLGVLGAAAKSRWFARRGLDFWTGYPGASLRLTLRKGLDLLAGREIPRNETLDVYRRVSPILRLLVFRKGVGVPFGVVAPLALAGALLAWRTAPPGRRASLLLLLGTAGVYALSIVVFFPTDRYRLPLVPFACLFAGRLLAEPRFLLRPTLAATLALGFVLFNLDAAVASESYPEEEALNRAYALGVLGRTDEARGEYLRAIELNPRRIDAPNALAVMAAGRNDWEEAAARYRQVLDLAPDFIEVRCSLGEALLALGRRDEARREWETASRMAPAAGIPLADLALLDLEEGTLEPAYEQAARAVALRPDRAETHMALALAARALRRRDDALRELAEAQRLFPKGSAGERRAHELLDRMRSHTPSPASRSGPSDS
jgi:tetratricopeptide (TPR) repeat protein